MSFFFLLSITLDPDTASHMLFLLEGGNSENAKYLIYLWLRKRSLHEPKPSLLFVTTPAKTLKLSEPFLSTGVVIAVPAPPERLKPLIFTCALAQPLSAGQGTGMKQINEVVIGSGADVKSNPPNPAERQSALSYSQCTLFLLTVC